MLLFSKLQYLCSSLGRFLTARGRSCPSCGCAESSPVDRKLGITALRRCSRCCLLFRTPTTGAEDSHEFYQEEYTQSFAEVPDDKQLREMLETSFANNPSLAHDAWQYRLALEALGCAQGARLLDFGCSWGYQTWLLRKAGYDAQGFEISRVRCRFARERLKVDAVSSRDKVKGPYDIFFTVNVIEHVPSVSDMIDFAWRVLKPGGLFFCVTCNGSADLRALDPGRWHKWWGHVHPQLLDDVFYEKTFQSSGYLLASSPFDFSAMRRWDGTSRVKLGMSGSHLLVAVRRPQ